MGLGAAKQRPSAGRRGESFREGEGPSEVHLPRPPWQATPWSSEGEVGLVLKDSMSGDPSWRPSIPTGSLGRAGLLGFSCERILRPKMLPQRHLGLQSSCPRPTEPQVTGWVGGVPRGGCCPALSGVPMGVLSCSEPLPGWETSYASGSSVVGSKNLQD